MADALRRVGATNLRIWRMGSELSCAVNLSHMVALFNTGGMFVAKLFCVVHQYPNVSTSDGARPIGEFCQALLSGCAQLACSGTYFLPRGQLGRELAYARWNSKQYRWSGSSS